MKVYLRYGLLTILAFSAGCGSFLEVNPDNRVELDTPEKAAKLLTNAYGSGAYTFTEWMGDNVVYTFGTFKLPEHIQMYNWEDATVDNQDTPTYFWQASYEAIAHANEVLTAIDAIPGDRALKDADRGEALLCRAYAHFMLVNLFAKQYDPLTASNDPGIPYIEKPETEFIVKYKRNTVAEVYSKIEKDLREGLRLVDDQFYANSGKYHFTKNAALAFASRFFLFKGDFSNCINYSTELLGDDPDVFVKDLPTILQTYTNTFDFLQTYTSPNDQSNLLLIRQITNYPVTVGFWPDIALINSLYNNNPFGADDIRRNNRYPLFVRGTNGVAVAKYEFLFERSSLTSNVGLYYTIAPVFRGEEVLLNRAEAYAFTNNLTEAVKDLQVYVDKRYEQQPTISLSTLRGYYGTTNSGVALVSFILDERRKEFIHEGLRWFDLKRYRIPVTHDTESGGVIELSAEDLRKVLQIPQAAVDVGGLEPNPR